jgi:hypothetical protein
MMNVLLFSIYSDSQLSLLWPLKAKKTHTNNTFILKKLCLGLPANSALLNFFGFGGV